MSNVGVRLAGALVGWVGLVVLSAPAVGADKPRSSLGSLEFRAIGPNLSGRATRVAGVPGDPLTYYVAYAQGGVWKSVNGGRNWSPIFDDEPTNSIGSLAIAPSDANVIYVGSGEANIRGNVAWGDGIYRSTDAGKTWQHVWKTRGQIGTMAVDPGIRTSPTRQCSAPRSARTRTAVSIEPPMAVAAGRRCSIATPRPARPTSRSIRRTRACCTRGCGRRGASPGT